MKHEIEDLVDSFPDIDDPTASVREMRGEREGQCVHCHRYFYGLGAFEVHQRPAYHLPAGVVCLDPASIGLVVIDHRGSKWWAKDQKAVSTAPANARRFTKKTPTSGQ